MFSDFPRVLRLQLIPRRPIFFSALLLATVAGPSRAQTVTSTYLADALTALGTEQDWSNFLNWTVLPQPGYNVTINNGLVFPALVKQNVDASVAILTLGTGATLKIDDGRNLVLTGNSVINGSLLLAATAGVSELRPSGAITLSGTGAITMSANAGNRIFGANGSGDSLVNQSTIQGSGSVGLGLLAITNQGTIVANNASVPLVLTPNSGGFANSGTLRATNGATLSLQSGTFTNTSGVIEAQNASTVSIANSSLTSGTLTITGTGALQLANATLTNVNVTNSATGTVRALSGVNTLFGLYTDAFGSQVRIDNGAKIALPGGAGGVTINGGIYLDGTASDTVLEISAGGLPVSGSGKLVLSNSAFNRVIGGGVNPSVTFGSGFTVEGAGKLGDGLLGITNQGLISANQPTSLIISPNALGVTNTGTLRATAGGTLRLATGAFTNTGGLVEAQTASTVQLAASTLNGGTLATSGSGKIDVIGANTLQNVTLAAGSSLNFLDGSVSTLLGTLTNDGTMALTATGNNTDLVISGAVNLIGAGNLTLSNSAQNRIYSLNSGSLTIGANQTLSGAGLLGQDNLSLVNQGTIVADRATPLILNNAGSTFSNSGILKATGTGGLVLSDATVVNQGTIEIATGSSLVAAGAYSQPGSSSATRLTNGSLSASSFSFSNGTLAGSGSINGAFSAVGGTSIIPGGLGAIGTLTFTQSLTLGPSTAIYFDLGGTTAGTGHDHIDGTTVVVGGNLFLAFANAFQFSVTSSDTLTLFDATISLTGTFSGLANGARILTTDGLGSFQVNYLANSLTLTNFQAVPEPSTYALLGLGAVTVLLVERRRRRAVR